MSLQTQTIFNINGERGRVKDIKKSPPRLHFGSLLHILQTSRILSLFTVHCCHITTTLLQFRPGQPMNNENTLLTHVAITMTPRLNNNLYSSLFQQCGGIEGFFQESDRNVEILFQENHLENVKPERTRWLQAAEQELKMMEKLDIRFCHRDAPEYPYLLKQCEDAPLVLFYRGTLETPETKNIAIVGTRKASERGKAKVESLLQQLSEMGYHPNIISGLAYGIDITAHIACIHHGLRAQAILGHGLHMIYPAPHKNIAEKIVEQGGALISEYPTCARITPANFLQRNRIIAGMSEAVLVAESSVKGGAMSTARQALSYNREVMAIPGRPEDTTSSGCNLLIKQNIAALVENITDILKIIHWEPLPTHPYQTSLDLFPPSEDETTIKQALMTSGEQNIDQLHLITRIPVHDLSVILLKLELEGVVIQLPGKCYALI